MRKLFDNNFFFFPWHFLEADIGTWLHIFRVDLMLGKDFKMGRAIILIVFVLKESYWVDP